MGQRILLMVGPVLVALVIAGAILAAAGVDPLAYYGYVLQRGLFSAVGIQQTLTRMAPLLFVAAGCFIAGSICESAQNTLDRWYLTGTPPSLLDLLFNTLIVAGLAAQILSVSDSPWAWLAPVAVVAYAASYLAGWPTPPWQALAGVAAAAIEKTASQRG